MFFENKSGDTEMRWLDRVIFSAIAAVLSLSISIFMHGNFFAFPREITFMGRYIEFAVYGCAIFIPFQKSARTSFLLLALIWSLLLLAFLVEALANHLF